MNLSIAQSLITLFIYRNRQRKTSNLPGYHDQHKGKLFRQSNAQQKLLNLNIIDKDAAI